MRGDVVEHGGRLGLAHGAHGVMAQEPCTLPPEAGVRGVDVPWASVAAVGGRCLMGGAVAVMHGVVGTAWIPALLVSGIGHRLFIQAARVMLHDARGRTIQPDPAEEPDAWGLSRGGFACALGMAAGRTHQGHLADLTLAGGGQRGSASHHCACQGSGDVANVIASTAGDGDSLGEPHADTPGRRYSGLAGCLSLLG